MKTYFAFIRYCQEILMATSVVILGTLPTALVLKPEWFTDSVYLSLYSIAHFALFLVMAIRPLADIFKGVNWLRPLVILRKGLGVFSAAIVVSFILSKVIMEGSVYFTSFLTPEYWSLENFALLIHLADISAILLLVTSNNLSKRLLGSAWKRIQRLSYVYFYASATYVIFVLGENLVIAYVVLVTLFTTLAWLRNHGHILKTPNLQTN